MAEDFGPLRASLQRVYPGDRLETLTEQQLGALRKQHPGVPEHYLALMREVGWGSLGGTFMLYSGLVEPDNIFDPETACGLRGLLFFGDNYSGNLFGFDTNHGWQIAEVDGSDRLPWFEDAKTIGEFLTQRFVDQEG